MKNPYMAARKRPRAGPPSPFMKNETVIGTIGNTQGVSRAAKPQRMASIISAQSVPLPAASCCAGTISAAVVSAVPEAVSAAASAGVSLAEESLFGETAAVLLAAAEPGRAVSSTVSSVSSGGMQLTSSQIIHSIAALTVALAAASFTCWAKRALPAKVPISISNVLS